MEETMEDQEKLEKIAKHQVHRPTFGAALNLDFCVARAHDDGMSVGFHQCSRKAKIEEFGHRWCFQHAPSKILAKQIKWEEKYQQDRKRDSLRWARRAAYNHIARVAIDYFCQKATLKDIEDAVYKYEGIK